MERIEYSIDIDHAVEEVFCFIARPENEPKWRNGLTTSEATSEGPMKVGSTGRRVQSFLGRKMENDWTVTDLTPNRRIAITSTSGRTCYSSAYSFEPTDAGTKLTIESEAETGDFFKIPDPVVTRMAKRQLEADMEALKTLLEKPGPVS